MLYFVSRVDPWLLCGASSELVFRRSLQDCSKLWVIGLGAGAECRSRSEGGYESCCRARLGIIPKDKLFSNGQDGIGDLH